MYGRTDASIKWIHLENKSHNLYDFRFKSLPFLFYLDKHYLDLITKTLDLSIGIKLFNPNC